MALTAKKVYAILKRQISDMEAKLNSPVRYRGTVATADLLPLNPDIGDMYNIESKSIYGEAGMNVAWNGVVWDTMGAPIDMSLYLTKEGADTTIQNMVNEYLENNPIKPGATTEQAQQIKQNKTDIDSLKEDLSNKITKFYASNQGETHITDSDNGKIQDMQIFGRSEQKKYNGYQLFALAPTNLSTGKKVSLPYTKNGITVDIANDGIGYTVRGTNTLNEQQYDIYLSMPNAFDIEAGTYTRSGKIINGNNNVELISGGGASSGECLEYRANKVDFTFTETVKKGKSGNFVIRISPSVTVNAIVYFQIEKGSEAHDFEPYVGGQPSPSPDYPQEIKSVVNPTVKMSNEDGTKSQTVTLPYTLNAIPVSSGGNVTIGGQQYIADRVVEKDGVFGIERNIREIHTNTKTMNNTEKYPGWNKVEGISDTTYYSEKPVGASKILTFISNFIQTTLCQNNTESNNVVFLINDFIGYSQSDLIAKAIDVDMYIRLQNAIFEPLPVDMQAKLRTLVTNYPVTNISVNSEQLDGYTVFNYPISLANGWNYVKQQLNDNRDYIYDMDLQSAEAYVNSEYAVALTELEV